jgi:type IV pilus assembly protein PilM
VDDAGGRLTVQTFGPVALPADAAASAPDALIQGLSALLSSAGAKRAPLAVAIPRSEATIKFPVLPRTGPQQLAQMVRFEAQRYVPFPVEDVILSFQDLPAHSREEVTPQGVAEQMEIMLAAVRRDVVGDYRQALTAAGGSLSHLTISTTGLWDALKHSPIPTAEDEALVVLDLGGKSSTVAAFHKGEMIFNRSTGVGSDRLTAALMETGADRASAESAKRDVGVEPLLYQLAEGPLVREANPAENWTYSLVSELRRSLAALRGERRGLRFDRLFLVGGGSKTPGLCAYLERSLGMTAQVLELPGLVSDPQFIEATGVAIGALSHEVSSLDLIRDEFERERKKKRDTMKMRLTALAGAIILAVAVFFAISAMQTQKMNEDRIKRAQGEVTVADGRLKNVQTKLDQITSQAKILGTALRPQHNWLDVLQDISDRAPSSVWISGIDMEKGKPLAIRGSSLNQAGVLTFSSNVARSPLLSHPTLSYSNQAKVSEKTIFQFGIAGDIIGNLPKPSRPPKKRGSSASARSSTSTGTSPAESGGSGSSGGSSSSGVAPGA